MEPEKIEAMLSELQKCIDENGDMRACLHKLVPTFREPHQVNGEKGNLPEAAAQEVSA